MNRTRIYAALAAGFLVVAGASAQTVRPDHRPGAGFGRHRYYHPHFGLGVGLGWGYDEPFPARTVYRNAFTGDVTYAERTVNAFRAAYEKRGGDPLGLKSEIQRLDEDFEKIRDEAESYGAVTIRGTELLRDALTRADVIDKRMRASEDPLSGRWGEVDRLLDSLSRTYRLS